MATITHDTLDWYGFDDDGGSVHDVIGTDVIRIPRKYCLIKNIIFVAIQT